MGAFQAIDNPQERLANLTTLLQGLSPWERRHLRTQLGARDGLATLEDMPVDIACIILRYLHIEDVLALAAVSTGCRTTFTEPSVASAMSLHFFPALRAPFNFLSFKRQCRKYLRRRAGKFTSRLDLALPFQSEDSHIDLPLSNWQRDYQGIFSPDPVLHPKGEYPKAWLEMTNAYFGGYGGGNLVWYALPGFLVVDNLPCRTRKVLKIPGGMNTPPPENGQVAASKSLVAIQPHSRDKMYVLLEKTALACCSTATWVLTDADLCV
ncbi:F-box protein [Candidatus Bathyarchaeota archaeon]|nr:F-box protein [Candidatus Bathyarchaeota archaeon]